MENSNQDFERVSDSVKRDIFAFEIKLSMYHNGLYSLYIQSNDLFGDEISEKLYEVNLELSQILYELGQIRRNDYLDLL